MHHNTKERRLEKSGGYVLKSCISTLPTKNLCGLQTEGEAPAEPLL